MEMKATNHQGEIGCERRAKRREHVARMRREGRPVGHAPLGFRLVGRRGHRRLVPDQAQREMMRMVLQLRDEEGLSWDCISDRIEEHVAAKENRRPRTRGFRTGWTGKSVWRMYHAAKRLSEGEPKPSHRRCQSCNRSLLVEKFADNRDICVECEITGPLKRMELRRQRLVAAALLAIGRASERGCSPEELKEIAAMLVEKGNGPSLAALDIEMFLAQLTRQCPGERQTFDAIYGLMHLMTLGETLGDSGKPVTAMSDAELERELHRELRREFADFFELYDELVALDADMEDDDDR